MEEVGDCEIVIGNTEVGIIGAADSIDNIVTAITNLIRGSKQANMYYFLERMNAARKHNTEISTFKNAKKIDDNGEAK
jgi:rRNA processing protein Krr1/Pno1